MMRWHHIAFFFFFFFFWLWVGKLWKFDFKICLEFPVLIFLNETITQSWDEDTQRCQPSLFDREAPYFVNIFVQFWHPSLTTSPFLSSFVPLKLHVILKTCLFFVWILPIFWILMLASLDTTGTEVYVKSQVEPKSVAVWPLWRCCNRHMGHLVLGCSGPVPYRKKEPKGTYM